MKFVQACRETIIDILTEIRNKVWKTLEWPSPWPKKGNQELCQNYNPISLISHSYKVMLKVVLNRLESQAEEIIAEEQAVSRAGRVPHK